MKLRVEIDPAGPEEIVIRAHGETEGVQRVQRAVTAALQGGRQITLKRGEEEFFLPCREMLFAETGGSRVWVHTAGDCFLCPMRLHELAECLPRSFVKASKSCLINTAAIRSLLRTPTGVGRAAFAGSEKVAYISRMYYKIVRDTIEEMRLK